LEVCKGIRRTPEGVFDVITGLFGVGAFFYEECGIVKKGGVRKVRRVHKIIGRVTFRGEVNAAIGGV